jgi:hypothetical protein
MFATAYMGRERRGRSPFQRFRYMAKDCGQDQESLHVG